MKRGFFEMRATRLSSTLLIGMLLLLSAPKAEAEAQWATPTAADGAQFHLNALSSPDPSARITAIQALGEAREVAAVQPLSQLLRSDPDPTVRGWIVRSLASIGTAETRAALTYAAQNDTDTRVRGLAAQMLGQVNASPFEAGEAEEAGAGREGLGFLISGWSVFGGTYVLALMFGALGSAADGADEAWPLFIPLAGPIIESVWLFGELDVPGLGVVAILDGLFQMTGLALAIVGHVRRSRARAANPEQAGEETARRERGFNFAFLPMGPGGSSGLSFAGAF